MSLDILRITHGRQICRPIQLPMRGRVLVRTGQRVEMDDIIAEYVLPERFMVYNVQRGFGLSASKAESQIERLVGEHVEPGDVIAQSSGLFARVFRVPQEGRVISIHSGKVILALGEVKHICRASFPGIVVELIPERGAVICGQGAILQGVWGNGKNAQGELIHLGEAVTHPYDQKELDIELNGKIVSLGSCLREDLLTALLESGAAGLIVSSLAPLLQSTGMNLGIPLMSLAGFGDIQTDAYSEAMIKEMVGRKVFLNAYMPDPFSAQRPEMIVPLSEIEDEGLFDEEVRLRIGSKVRLIGNPYTGNAGEVIELPAEMERFASGLELPVAVVKRTDDQLVRIPTSNLEVII